MTANLRRKSRQKDKTSQTESDITQQAISRSDLHQGKKEARDLEYKNRRERAISTVNVVIG